MSKDTRITLRAKSRYPYQHSSTLSATSTRIGLSAMLDAPDSRTTPLSPTLTCIYESTAMSLSENFHKLYDMQHKLQIIKIT